MPEDWQARAKSCLNFKNSNKINSESSQPFTQNRKTVFGDGNDAITIPTKSVKNELIHLFLSQSERLLHIKFKQLILLLREKICRSLATISDQSIQDCPSNHEPIYPDTPLN